MRSEKDDGGHKSRGCNGQVTFTCKGQPKGHIHVQRHMNVPCFAQDEDDEIIGVLGVGNKEAEYTDADAAQLKTFIEEAWPVLEELE